MDGDQIARLMYLGFLVLAIAGWYVTQNRVSMGKNMQFAVIWGLIFIGAIATVGLWEDIRRDTASSQFTGKNGAVEVQQSPDGHYYLTLDINDVPVRFTVDTGASNIVLSAQDARRVGFDPENLAYINQAYTANGVVHIALVTLDKVGLENITDRNLRASVNGGELHESLLGMDYLNRFSRIELGGGKLTLHR